MTTISERTVSVAEFQRCFETEIDLLLNRGRKGSDRVDDESLTQREEVLALDVRWVQQARLPAIGRGRIEEDVRESRAAGGT